MDEYCGTLGMTPTNELPEYYWNVKSQEQRIYIICTKIEELKKLVDSYGAKIDDLISKYSDIEKLTKELKEEFSKELSEYTEKIESEFNVLTSDFENFKEHGFDLYYKKQVEIWIENNLEEIWKSITARVFFGLTQDGHFVAYVPESWQDLEFSTGDVYGSEEYGHLILSYE